MAVARSSQVVALDLDRLLHGLLGEIARELKMLDEDVTLFQFGSSASKGVEGGTDVDLMILSDRLAEEGDFDRRLAALRAGLLRGEPTSSFSTASGMLQSIVGRLAKEFSLARVRFVPLFAFGPLPNKNPFDTVPLHVNGPISAAQLHAFCRLLPLHARAIIHNARVINGTFDPWRYAPDAHCDDEELRNWLLSLKARFHRFGSQNPRKMLRKLLLNVAMYKHEYRIREGDLLATARDYLPTRLSERDLDRMSAEQVRAVFWKTLKRALEAECRRSRDRRGGSP